MEERLEFELKEIAKSYALKLAEEKMERKGGLKYILKEMIRDEIGSYTAVERIFEADKMRWI